MEPIFFELSIVQENKQVCLVDLPTGQIDQKVEQTAEWLAAQYANDLEQTDLLILRPDVGTPISNIDDYKGELHSLARKAPRATIHVLYCSNFKHQLSQNLSPHHAKRRYSKKVRDSVLEDIRECEFEHYVRHSDALLSAREGFVYRAPSGHYVRKFLRVGNIQKSRQALDATFFWMLPYLEDRRTIIADTWSISSIAINAARLLGKYQSGEDCKVDFLPSYFDGNYHSRTDTEAIFRHAYRGKKPLLMLFSAVRSGRSLRRLQDAFLEILPDTDIEYLAIYGLNRSARDRNSVSALCAGLKGFEDVERTGSVVRIDSSSFFPMTAKDKPLWIKKTDADGNREFFRHYKGLNAVRIHRDVRDSSGQILKHHTFDINVEALLLNSRFLKRFHEKLFALPYPSVIVVPPHNAGIRLGNEARQFLKATKGELPELVVHSDLDPKDGTLNQVFKTGNRQKGILILDDVSTTGQRLSRFQANLRSWGFQGRVSYLVGVARPNDEEVWVSRVQNLRLGEGGQQNDVEYVEKIILPNWKDDKCPWCLEYKWLSEMIRTSSFGKNGSNLAIARRRLLEEASDGQGLVGDVFWIPPQQQRPTITRGSIFLPHVRATEADIVASVAGAIQRMRTDPQSERRLKADFPQPRVLSPHNFLGPSPRYNDLILRMSVLRNALPSELRRWDDEDETQLSSYLCNAFVDDQCKFALELTVAISQRKFPLIANMNVRSVAIRSRDVKKILNATLKK